MDRPPHDSTQQQHPCSQVKQPHSGGRLRFTALISMNQETLSVQVSSWNWASCHAPHQVPAQQAQGHSSLGGDTDRPLPASGVHWLWHDLCKAPPRCHQTWSTHKRGHDARYLRLVGGSVVRDGHELLWAQALQEREWLLLSARHGLCSLLCKPGRDRG